MRDHGLYTAFSHGTSGNNFTKPKDKALANLFYICLDLSSKLNSKYNA